MIVLIQLIGGFMFLWGLQGPVMEQYYSEQFKLLHHKMKRTNNLISTLGKRIVLVELILIFLIIFFVSPLFLNNVFADIDQNVTVTGNLTIGSSDPNVLSVNFQAGTVTLTPNSTTLVNCSVIAEDYDGEADITNVYAEIFSVSGSSYGDVDDDNTHYTNSSCVINTSYGDSYQIKADCFFEVQYYANPGNWNCSV